MKYFCVMVFLWRSYSPLSHKKTLVIYMLTVFGHITTFYFYQMKKTGRSPQGYYSPVKFIKEVKTNFKPEHSSNLFVPYAQERDGLGRLIKHKKKEQIQMQLKMKISHGTQCFLVNNCISQTCVSLSDKVSHIQDIITNSFQYKNPSPVKLYESNKIPIHKKIAVSIPTIKQNRKYSGQDLNVGSMTELQTVRQRFLSYDLTLYNKNEESTPFKQQSLPKTVRNTNKFTDQSKSNKDSSLQKSPQKSKLKNSLAASSSTLQKLKKKLNVSPIQKILLPLGAKIQNDGSPINLQGYRRWPKLNSQIEKSNQIFLSKLRQSKKLAYKLKVTLQNEQWNQK